MILPNSLKMPIAYNIYFAGSWVYVAAEMTLPQAKNQVHILFLDLFIPGPAASWGMLFSWQMAGAQEAKRNQASTFKISASIISTDVLMDMVSHVVLSISNAVVKYILALGRKQCKVMWPGDVYKILQQEESEKEKNPIYHTL